MKKTVSILTLVVMLCTIFSASLSTASASGANNGFVYANGTHFYLNGKTFYVAGCNSYNLFRVGSGSTYGNTEAEIIEHTINGYMNTEEIDQCMANMAASGINVVRTWAFSSESWHGFEKYENGSWTYLEPQFMEFDYIIKSAKDHGIKIIPVLETTGKPSAELTLSLTLSDFHPTVTLQEELTLQMKPANSGTRTMPKI